MPETGCGLGQRISLVSSLHTTMTQVSPSVEYKGAGLDELSKEVCKGDSDAMLFCGLWMGYCHGIDDLIDNMIDGHATTSPEEILRLFATAAVIYNSNFYRKHQQQLFPLVLAITNMYADSVAWEKSPVEHKRKIADTLRCCGNEMYFMVALICGGYQHMRVLSPKIRERSWILQHNDDKDRTD